MFRVASKDADGSNGTKAQSKSKPGAAFIEQHSVGTCLRDVRQACCHRQRWCQHPAELVKL